MSTQKRLFTAMTPSFCSLTDTKQSLQYTIKTHLSGPPMSKFEANMNYIPPSPPSSMKQCNKSATVKFHMELLLTTTTRKQSRSGATPSASSAVPGSMAYTFTLLVCTWRHGIHLHFTRLYLVAWHASTPYSAVPGSMACACTLLGCTW